jgi:predicted ThiF/HesA family dinucleotide-utilizing enzyme
MKIDTVLIIGAGGIGGFLIPPLVRLLELHHIYNVKVYDGDSYTPSNRSRQIFNTVGEPKALAMGKTLSWAKWVQVYPEYINETNIHAVLNNLVGLSLVIPAVDNMATRHLILKNLKGRDFIWVCPGNGYTSYTLSHYDSQIEGAIHPFDIYFNLKNPDDHLPGSCGEEIVSHPQLLATNACVAALTLASVTSILNQRPLPKDIQGDIFKPSHEI